MSVYIDICLGDCSINYRDGMLNNINSKHWIILVAVEQISAWEN
jgi:hypothetical protein